MTSSSLEKAAAWANLIAAVLLIWVVLKRGEVA